MMFGNRRHFRELLTQSEERIASNILADRLMRLEAAGYRTVGHVHDEVIVESSDRLNRDRIDA